MSGCSSFLIGGFSEARFLCFSFMMNSELENIIYLRVFSDLLHNVTGALCRVNSVTREKKSDATEWRSCPHTSLPLVPW